MHEGVFVIVPCYNEQVTIRKTLRDLCARGYQVVCVDDGSFPPIKPLVVDLEVTILRHNHNQGQGASLQTGMDYAIRQGAAVLVHFDADGQHQVDDIDALIYPILARKSEVVLGSRFLKPEDKKAIPWLRRNMLRLARVFNGLFTGIWLTDAHNGLRAFSREAAQQVRITQNRMAHATEILLFIKHAQLSYCEVSTHVIYPAYSRKKSQPLLNSVGIVLDLLAR